MPARQGDVAEDRAVLNLLEAEVRHERLLDCEVASDDIPPLTLITGSSVTTSLALLKVPERTPTIAFIIAASIPSRVLDRVNPSHWPVRRSRL